MKHLQLKLNSTEDEYNSTKNQLDTIKLQLDETQLQLNGKVEEFSIASNQV